MLRFIESADRDQLTLLPECRDDWVGGSNPVRVVDAFVEALDLDGIGFWRHRTVGDRATRLSSSGAAQAVHLRLFGKTQSRGDLATTTAFAGREDDRQCAKFVWLCRRTRLLMEASVAIDGSKFKAVNTRDKNFTKGKVERRRQRLEESVSRYLAQLDTADLQEPSETLAAKTAHLKEKFTKLKKSCDLSLRA
ncbi:hypothetical protein ACFPFP_42455 [Bradyrhizobium sp. GCM10023182]|uniref:hypothetical protein n=1 Tax=Bradyrhizobium TaxID=374 RepID=UPI00361BC503